MKVRAQPQTIIPDYYNGDPIGPSAMDPGVSVTNGYRCVYPRQSTLQNNFDNQAWFANHGAAQTRSPLDKVIAVLKAEGVTALARLDTICLSTCHSC